jgi:hypothetical protein
MTATNITAAARQDAQLERAANRSRRDLAEHRWHWTLDTSNPRRVTPGQYAKLVNRHRRTIEDMVTGYAEWFKAGAQESALADYLATAKLRGDTKVATLAVAKAKNIGVDAARLGHAAEIRSVKATAEERAETRGTRVEDEVETVANKRAQHQATQQHVKTEAASRTNVRLISVEGKIAAAMRYLRSALDETNDVEFSADDRAEVAELVGKLKAVANLLEVRLVGSTDVDWDREMAKLTGNVR